MNNKGADQTAQMCKLICAFVVCIEQKQVFSWRSSNYCCTHSNLLEQCEPRHDKTNKVTVHPAKTQFSLGIRPVWPVFAERMKKAWVLSYPLSAQRRLISLGECPGWSWVFAGRPLILLYPAIKKWWGIMLYAPKILSVRPSVLHFQTRTWVVFDRFSSNFAWTLILGRSSLGLQMG